jgi:hypothetical protein
MIDMNDIITPITTKMPTLNLVLKEAIVLFLPDMYLEAISTTPLPFKRTGQCQGLNPLLQP